MRILFLVVACFIASARLDAQASPGSLPLSGPGVPPGLTLASSDARYLKLDASNDPLTGGLDLNAGAVGNLSLRFQFCSTCGAFYTGTPTNRVVWVINGTRMATMRSGAFLAEDGVAGAPSIAGVNHETTGLGWDALALGGDTLDFIRGGVIYMSLGNNALIPSLTDDVFNLGLSTRSFNTIFLDTELQASSDGKAVKLTDPDGVGVGVGGSTMVVGQTVSGDVGVEQQQNAGAGGEPNYFRMPGYAAAGASAKPTCTSVVHEGRFWVSRNVGTGDTFLCFCRADNASAFAIEAINLNTGSIGVCP